MCMRGPFELGVRARGGRLLEQRGQRRVHLVLVGEDQLGGIEGVIALERGPLHANGGVVPHEAALVAGVVGVVALVAELRLVREDEEAVGKAARDKELAAVLGRRG